MKPKFFTSARVLHRWLEGHHATTRELTVGFWRRRLARGLTYKEALDEALAFGWIDGVRNRLDAESYAIRFTPRRPGSIWSTVNIARARELAASGRMRPAGLRAFHERDERKTRQYSYEREQKGLDSELESRLRADPGAATFFDRQPPGYRRTVSFWIMSAKKEETRLRRLAHLIERSAHGARIDLLNPSRP